MNIPLHVFSTMEDGGLKNHKNQFSGVYNLLVLNSARIFLDSQEIDFEKIKSIFPEFYVVKKYEDFFEKDFLEKDFPGNYPRYEGEKCVTFLDFKLSYDDLYQIQKEYPYSSIKFFTLENCNIYFYSSAMFNEEENISRTFGNSLQLLNISEYITNMFKNDQRFLIAKYDMFNSKNLSGAIKIYKNDDGTELLSFKFSFNYPKLKKNYDIFYKTYNLSNLNTDLNEFHFLDLIIKNCGKDVDLTKITGKEIIILNPNETYDFFDEDHFRFMSLINSNSKHKIIFNLLDKTLFLQ